MAPMTGGGRLLIVANRLPVTVRVIDGQIEVERSTGGVATGLLYPHEQTGGVWIGWDGAAAELTAEQRVALDEQLATLRLATVPLSPEQVNRFYEGFANGTLWPLFHYLPSQTPPHAADWAAYREANERFADVVVAHYQPGDVIWVHDYQLLLLPELLRRRLPDARIGFFLHVPFPSEELFRTLPARDQLLRGMLGADLIGFHTPDYLRHFAAALVHILGVDVEIERVTVEDRDVRLGVFPMGIDAAGFAALAEHEDVCAEARKIRGDEDVRLLVGVDRLDYTKGIPRRLLAFEQMLQDHPELRERVRLVQVAVPSRIGVEAYQEFRAQVDGLVGRINGAFGTPRWSPVHYIYRGLSETELVGLYRAADVMVVTPIRDGMNLVAKEFIASRPDGDGVLVVSEFAGAAWELPEALQVNPNDVDGTAEVLYRALTMEPAERRARLAPLRIRVEAFDVRRWARSFIDCLTSLPRRPPGGPPLVTPAAVRTAIEQRLDRAPNLLALLDYDGTLVPYASLPDLARPDRLVFRLLAGLAARPRTEVHLVSGRSRDILDQWLGALPIILHAEHGFWSRNPGGEWTAAAEIDLSWRDPVLAILRDFAARTPGALVEVKSVAMAWHYRMVDPEVGTRRANELRLHLKQLLSNQPVEILAGNKVIEIRPYGINKGRIIPALSPEQAATRTIFAAGDDRTDEDLFGVLPEHAISVRVGPGITHARYRLNDVASLRLLLESLLHTPIPA